MQNWNFIPEQPISLPLAADVRLNQTDYLNDQIWEFKLGYSDPPSISIETTFGLRARLCKIYPQFTCQDKTITSPAQFSQPIKIIRYYPNFIELSFKIFSTINVRIEYWVPSSQAIAGRARISNVGHEPCSIQLEWVELLLPTADGERMTVSEIGMSTLLTGKTATIAPVLCLTGGAQPGKNPHPSLNLSYVVPPRSEQESRWVHASLADIESSYESAKEIINKNWDAEIARIHRMNSRSIEIHSGSKEWDTAFLLSRNFAYQLFLHPKQNCRFPSFVTTRKPDQGYSLLNNGFDYNHFWSGQTPIESRYLMHFLLPEHPELLKGILDNFLDTQSQNGEIDWKPGLGGQRSHFLASPTLSDIALRLYQYDQDIEYLNSVFPKLLDFFRSWFSATHDRDGDGIPEWDQTLQTGFDYLPLFSQHNPWSKSIDISTVECPDLVSYLYREYISLFEISKIIGNPDGKDRLLAIGEALRAGVENTWSDELISYRYRDRDSHLVTSNEPIGSFNGPGIIQIDREFNQPVRPLVKITFQEETTRIAKIFIHGTGASGTHRVELIPTVRIHWGLHSGSATSEYCYKSIEKIEIAGIQPEDSIIINTIDLTGLDQSLLLPLWAGIPSTERAKILTNLSIMNRKKFLSPHGLRSCVDFSIDGNIPDNYYGIYLPWNALVIEGMIRYGERKKAAEVFSRIMRTITLSMRSELGFYLFYDSETGKPLGTTNALSGLVPIGLFLDILGVRILSPSKVELSGSNPFPWPITIKYQGLTIIKQEKKTLVVFSNGQNLTVDNDHTQLITCE